MHEPHAEEAWDTIEAHVRACFARQGLMTTLGARIEALSPGRLALSMEPSAATSQHHGYVHAGVVTSLMDTACGFAALTRLPQGSEILSVEFKVNLLAPAIGDRIVARAEVLRTGRTLSVCRADAFASSGNGAEALVATMLATMIRAHTGKRT